MCPYLEGIMVCLRIRGRLTSSIGRYLCPRTRRANITKRISSGYLLLINTSCGIIRLLAAYFFIFAAGSEGTCNAPLPGRHNGVFTNTREIEFIADDVFVEIMLPKTGVNFFYIIILTCG